MIRKPIQDTTLLGKWEEEEKIKASDFTKNEADRQVLDGLILKGYEYKYDGLPNENGEMYSKDAIDDFINRYFVGKSLNMVVDIEHDHRPEWLAGKVLYLENNATGFYFVAYIPKTYMHYNTIKNLLQDGILQGFSKEGYAEGEIKQTKDGQEYFHIQKMDILRLSLVSTPANANVFEDMQETVNALRYKKVEDKPATPYDFLR